MSDGLAVCNEARHDPVEQELAQIEEDLAEFAGQMPQTLASVVQSALQAGGKRLRPRLLLWSAKACGADDDTLQAGRRFAVAVEYLHTATLLHDDLVDGARLRRGEQAAHQRFGPKEAVLAGDVLFARCLSMIAELDSIAAVKVLSRAAERMAIGEALELEMTRRPSVTEDDYFLFAAAKTAPLFSAAAELGAILAKAPRRQRQALIRFGEAVGTAFQVADDVLDIVAPTERSGKERGTDLRAGLPTLPIIKALSVRADTPDADEIAQALTNPRFDPTHALLLVQQHGVAPATLAARRLVNDARQALAELRPSPAVEALRALARDAVDRLT
jgi:octaprenyl-diphosphate synthase